MLVCCHCHSLVYPRLTFLIRDAFLRFTTTKEDYLEELLRGMPSGPEAPSGVDDDDDDAALAARLQRKTRNVRHWHCRYCFAFALLCFAHTSNLKENSNKVLVHCSNSNTHCDCSCHRSYP
jgi:hypothetical protein